jgi:hypothetical protein
LIGNELFDSLPMTYNSSRGLRNRRAYACRFPGTVLAWGRQNRGREHSLNPVNSTCYFSTLVVLLSSLLTCKDDAKQSKVSTNLPWHDFLDDKCIRALAFTHPSCSLFTFSEQLVPHKCAEMNRCRSKTNSGNARCVNFRQWRAIYCLNIFRKKNFYMDGTWDETIRYRRTSSAR